LALKNPHAKFYVFDINKTLIEKWNVSCPIYEEGLEEIINKVRNVNLFFTSDISVALSDVDVVYIAVATPTKTFG
jgi:UDPglucose 6-dehydrogenase